MFKNAVGAICVIAIVFGVITLLGKSIEMHNHPELTAQER